MNAITLENNNLKKKMTDLDKYKIIIIKIITIIMTINHFLFLLLLLL